MFGAPFFQETCVYWNELATVCAVVLDTGSKWEFLSKSSVDVDVWVFNRKEEARTASLHIQSNIRHRYAHTMVHSEMCNVADFAQEVTFSITLPETAFISSLSIEIDGRVYNAYVKGKEEAQRIYTEAVQHGRTAGHIAVSARDSNQFNVSVNVERRKKVIFRLTYEELLTRKLGFYKHIINLDHGQIIPDFSVTVNIEESSDITELKVTTLKQIEGTQHGPFIELDSSLANVERPNPHTTVVRFAPTVQQQETLLREGIRRQFIVQYDVDRSTLHSQVLVNDGYFTHYFAPEQLKLLPKHVTFVLDVSGSMQGHKMDQLREAMEKILTDLRSQDYFSIVIFSSGVQIWRLVRDGKWDAAAIFESDCSSLVVPATNENILRGKLAIYKLKADGYTNIHQAMVVAVHITELRKKLESVQPPEPIIIFMTDGQPTTGVCDREEIIVETTRLNEMGKATIFTLGLGNDVDFEFLKKLALRNSGFCRKIYEASDTALQLTDFYKEISSPLLSNINFIYQPEQVETISVTRHNFVTFYRGSELIVSGRIDPSVSEMEFRFGVTGNSSEGMRNFLPEETKVVFLKKAGFMERLWAYLTIQQLLDEEKRHEGQMSSNKKNQAMQLALKYSFVTPVTSLVVVRPDDQHRRATLNSEMDKMHNWQFMPNAVSQPQHLFGQNINSMSFGSSAGQQLSKGFGSPQIFSSPTFGQAFGKQSDSTVFSFDSVQTNPSLHLARNKASSGHGLFGSVEIFGSGQTTTNQGGHGLFGSAQTFGSGQTTTNQGGHGLFGSAQTFGSGQTTTNQGGHGLFGSAQTFGSRQTTTNQGGHGLFGSAQTFGSGQTTTNQGGHGLFSSAQTFGSGQTTTNQGGHGLFGSAQTFGSGQTTTNQGGHGLFGSAQTFGSGQTTTNQGGHGLFGSAQTFGSRQTTTNQGGHGLFGSAQTFGSAQATANQGQEIFDSAQTGHGFTFGSAQARANQGSHELFGSTQTGHGFTFGSGQVKTDQGADGLATSSGQASTDQGGGQDTDAMKAHGEICNGVIQDDVPEHLEKHIKVAHPAVLTTSNQKTINLSMSEKYLTDALTDMILVDGRPLSILNDSWLKKILDPIASGLNVLITPNVIHQKISDRCDQVEQIISKELIKALVCMKFEIATKLGQTFLAIHAQYIHEGKKMVRTLVIRKLNPDWNKNHIIDIVTSTLERFGIKNVFYVTVNIVKNIPDFLNESLSNKMSNDEDSNVDNDDRFFKTICEACSMLGMSVFWNPTYSLQLAVHQTLETHHGIVDKLKNLKLSTQESDQQVGRTSTVTEQGDSMSIEHVSQVLKPLLTSFHQSKWQFGDVCNMWLNCYDNLSKLGTSLAESLSTNMKKTSDEILKNPVFLSALYLDLRYKSVLNDEQKILAIEELKRLWQSLSSSKDVEVTSNEAEIVEKLKLFATIPQISQDADILQLWESLEQQETDMKKLAGVVLSVPVLQDTVERINLNVDIVTSREPVNVKQDIVKIRCFNMFDKS